MSEQSKNPTVSIIMAVYNGAEYLQEALSSVAEQTFQDWELIVIDDGSQDASPQIAAAFPDVRLIRQQNQGSADARNRGILNSRGSLLAFLDQDDVWCPTKLERQIALFNNNPLVDLCYTGFDIIDSAGATRTATWGRPIQGYHDLLEGNGICFCTAMIRQACLSDVGLFDVSLTNCEDYDLWLRISKGGQLAYIPSIEAHYRVHPSSTSRDYLLMYSREKEILRRHIKLARASNDKDAVSSASRGLDNARRVRFADACREIRTVPATQKFGHLWNAWTISPGQTVAQMVIWLSRLLTTGSVREKS